MEAGKTCGENIFVGFNFVPTSYSLKSPNGRGGANALGGMKTGLDDGAERELKDYGLQTLIS